MVFFFIQNIGIEILLPQFTSALVWHYDGDGAKLYQPSQMKKFSDQHAPGLFDILLQSISRHDDRMSADHHDVQLQRLIALLHILEYFR